MKTPHIGEMVIVINAGEKAPAVIVKIESAQLVTVRSFGVNCVLMEKARSGVGASDGWYPLSEEKP